MRATLNDARLARYAGQFVWLELDFDKPGNREFLHDHAVGYTPTLFVIDPADGRAVATQLGGLTLPELTAFLERGERDLRRKSGTPAETALRRGDDLLGRGRYGDAARAYRVALRGAPARWAARDRAVASLTWALSSTRQWQECAQTAAAEAPRMPRAEPFVRVVLAGLWSDNNGGSADWAKQSRAILEPLAKEAISLPATLRDHRFQLYQALMHSSDLRGDSASIRQWGHRWLDELDATRPANDDERSALDIARVDAASEVDEPSRVLPALIESERAMPANYNASLRLAQMLVEAKRYDEAIAAAERGIRNATGPLGRSWLLRTKANGLIGKGAVESARAALQEALSAAREITTPSLRASNVASITKALGQLPQKKKA